MNLKTRLERLCDQRHWARLHFSDGTSLTGRMLRLGHDYCEMESYGEDDKPADRNYSKHLVPLQLLKLLLLSRRLLLRWNGVGWPLWLRWSRRKARRRMSRRATLFDGSTDVGRCLRRPRCRDSH